MSPATFATSPRASGEQRKFINPTPGWVGANVFGPDGKPTSVAVEPGGEVWLTAEEERMTAEAPRSAADNPFVKQWEEPVEFDTFGEPVRTVTRQGILVLSEEPPRPVASDRFIPERAPQAEAEPERQPEPEPEPAPAEDDTVRGADVPPPSTQPPVEGQPSPDEVVGAPEAVEANDEALSAREGTAEQPTRRRAIPAE